MFKINTLLLVAIVLMVSSCIPEGEKDKIRQYGINTCRVGFYKAIVKFKDVYGAGIINDLGDLDSLVSEACKDMGKFVE